MEINFKLNVKAGVCIFEKRCGELFVCGVRDMITSGEVEPGGGDIEAGASISPPPMANGNRDDQMAAIRQILSDVNKDADTEPKAEVEERPAPAAPRAPMRRRDDGVESGDTPKSWVDSAIKAGGAARGQPVPSSCDVAGLRRSHEKRVKALLRSKARRKQSGAFLTGFTLVSVVTATMVGLYALHPQIIAASPQMAPAMNEYVVTVDRFRVDFNEKTAEWKAWLVERIGNLAGKEE